MQAHEKTIDYRRMMRFLVMARPGFHSWLGIEYEGERTGRAPRASRRTTKALLEKIAGWKRGLRARLCTG
jgi:hypothetical protein